MREILINVTLIAVDTGNDLTESEYAIKQCTDKVVFAEVKLLTSKELPHVNSYHKYNEFMVKELHEHFDTDFVLTIQQDGYIINPQSWTNEFFDYDYIGATMPESSNPQHKGFRVGNGGFSLRSKKLCKATSLFDFPSNGLEDQFICRESRKRLEELGIKFAPVEIADKFSYINFGYPFLKDTFGYHGDHSLLKTCNNNNNNCSACKINKSK